MTIRIQQVAKQITIQIGRNVSPVVLSVPLLVISLIIVLQGTG